MNKTMMALALMLVSLVGQAPAQTIQLAPVSSSAGFASTRPAIAEAGMASKAASSALTPAGAIASASAPADAQAGAGTVSALKWIYALVTSDHHCETRTRGVQVNFNLPY